MPSNVSEKSSGPSLAATQELLRQLVTAPDRGVALLRLHPEWARLVKPSRTLSAAERVQIYANMYHWRLHDALAEDFPAVRAYVGTQEFARLVSAYLAAHPPSSFTVRDTGQHLPNFVDTSPWANTFPFLADIARFEWTLLTVFDGIDSPIMTEADLRQLPPNAWPALRLQLIPAHALLTLDWRVDQVHDVVTTPTTADATGTFQRSSEAVSAGKIHVETAMMAPREVAVPDRNPVNLLVWRKDDLVFYRPVDACEWALLRPLVHGTTCAELCELALAHGDESTAATTVGQLLTQWIHDQLLTTAS